MRAEGVRTFFYLLRGELVFAEEETAGETLGRLLVRQKRLTQEQYVQVIERMTDGLIENEQLRFGEVTVELGFLTLQEVQRALTDQVRWKIIRTLQREDHAFEFLDSTGQAEAVARYPLPLEPLVLEACRWIPDERKQRTLQLVPADRFIALREPPKVVGTRYQMTPDERAFLVHIDGRKRMGELLALAKSSEADIPALLTGMALSAGFLAQREPAPAPTIAEIATPSSGEFRAGSAAPAVKVTDGVHRGYVPTPTQFVPFRAGGATSSTPSAPEVTEKTSSAPDRSSAAAAAAKERADRAMALLRQARGSGSMRAVAPAEAKKPPSDHDARILGEQAFQRGRTYLFQGSLKQATSELDKAHKHQPQNVEYELYATWAAFALGTLAPDVGRQSLKQVANAALKADPNLAFAYYVMGEIALIEKSEPTAKRALEHAVKLDPNLVDAQRRLRMLSKRV